MLRAETAAQTATAAAALASQRKGGKGWASQKPGLPGNRIFSSSQPLKNHSHIEKIYFFYFHTENPLNSLLTEPALQLWDFLDGGHCL